MTFLQLKLKLSKNECEKIAEYLEENGALAISYLDAEDQPIYEPPLINSSPLWNHIILLALFEENCPLQTILSGMSLNESDGVIEKIEDKAWERVCMDQFKPQLFGKHLWIIPSWHLNETFPEEAIKVMLDPGLAFGTGTHPTTKLCLTWLSENHKENAGKFIIDYGCGSGILGISALKLGARKAIGIDIDPQARLASSENAHFNQVEFNVYAPEELKLDKKCKADMIIANILAGPLMQLVNEFFNLLTVNGKLVISGILQEQCEMFINQYHSKFKVDSQLIEEGWARIVLTRQ
jgi:ribosomal protein L11 methyltransferase